MYSSGARYSTEPQLSSGLSLMSRRMPFPSVVQKYSTGTSLNAPQTLHFHLLPPSTNWTKGLTYVLHCLQRMIPAAPKFTTGTGCFMPARGWMTAADGRHHCFFSSTEFGIALVASLTNFGSALYWSLWTCGVSMFSASGPTGRGKLAASTPTSAGCPGATGPADIVRDWNCPRIASVPPRPAWPPYPPAAPPKAGGGGWPGGAKLPGAGPWLNPWGAGACPGPGGPLCMPMAGGGAPPVGGWKPPTCPTGLGGTGAPACCGTGGLDRGAPPGGGLLAAPGPIPPGPGAPGGFPIMGTACGADDTPPFKPCAPIPVGGGGL
mmetsp:Transcript_2735/g.7512  ORF Transcript_2735/g.7512 Transcript_2735/m.7512 type:complete len:321 (-) Transcript_2735:388-1350(-)